ncbi:MAG: rhodanese-like domain-containing protein [Candidatus Brocadia sp. WS118]|nr:MAG: rhodanese-like domain-containing protein [Candidatus Brocadia sp. WS118]
MNVKNNSQKVLLSTALLLFLCTATGILCFKELHAEEGGAKTQAEVKNISTTQAKELIDKEKNVFILDVRTKEEYNEAHIKDANLIPVQELEQNINKIPKDKKVVVYCARGKRSANACAMLKDKGLKELYNVEGGINQWKSEGYPVEKP